MRASADDEQAILEAALLRLALIAHPEGLSEAELARKLRAEPAAVRRAAARLVEVGLLTRRADALAASDAAVRFDQLPVD